VCATDAEIVVRVWAYISRAHRDSIEYRKHAPVHSLTPGHRRYWTEVLALESLRDGMTIADLLASEHALVREAALLMLASAT
jgi:hypothetical protein